MKNIRMIKTLAIGISASMLLQPIVALAAEVSEEKTEVISAVDTSTTPYEEVKEEIENTVSKELDEAEEKVEEAAALELYDYEGAEQAIEDATGNLNDAAKDVQNAEDALNDEQKAADQIGVTIELVDEKVKEADKALDEPGEAASDAVAKEDGIDVDKSTVKEAEDAVDAIKDDVNKANGAVGKAEDFLKEAQDAYNKAEEELKNLEADKTASEEDLSAAKGKLADAAAALESAQTTVEENKESADTLYNENEKLSVFQQITDLKDQIAELTPEDEGYLELVDELSKLIVEFYVIGKVDEGTEVVFGEAYDEYITGYETDEDGNFVPVKKTVPYKTVTCVIDGEEVTRKIEFGFNESGTISISEMKITADEEEIVLLPEIEVVLTDADGNEFLETETSQKFLIDPEDESKGFYAIDTEVAEVIDEKDLLPEKGAEISTRNDEGLVTTTTYKDIERIDGDEDAISYDLVDGNIVKSVVGQYEVEAEVVSEHKELGQIVSSINEMWEALDDRINELIEMYGEDNFDSVYEHARVQGNGQFYYEFVYKLKEHIEETRPILISQTVYETNEYIDRTESVYLDNDGNKYDAKEYDQTVPIDAVNIKKGFYATNTNTDQISIELNVPISGMRYERDEQGRKKNVITDVSANPIKETTTYARETIDVFDRNNVEKESIIPKDISELYEILNKYQGQQDIAKIELKGIADDAWDAAVSFDDDWFTIAENDYAEIVKNTGGCEIIVSKIVPVTHKETGIVERVTGIYEVTTRVDLYDTAKGVYASEEEAIDAMLIMLEDLYDKYKGVSDDYDVYEIVTSDGNVAWEYVINYRISIEKTENRPFETTTALYKDIVFKNELSETRQIYNVSVADDIIASTDDEEFNNTVHEKNNAYKMAVDARKKADAAMTAYNKALDAVKQAKASVEALEKAGVPKTILDEAKGKLAKANDNLKNARTKKTDAEAAALLAEDSLEKAQEKLAAIRAKSPSPAPTPAPASAGTSDRADNANVGTTTVAEASDSESPAVAVISAAAGSNINGITAPAEAAVLGAKKTEDKKAASKKADDDKAEAESKDTAASEPVKEENAGEKATLTDSSEATDTTENDTQKKIAEIKEEEPALAPTFEPKKEKKGLGVLAAVVVTAAVVGTGTVGALVFTRKK